MTDWASIRKLMNTAIDTCEKIESLGVDERHRGVVVNDPVTIHEFLISSWVAPENLTRKVICKSHELGRSKPYTDDLARTMTSIGNLCSELVKLENIDQKIGSLQEPSIKNEVDALCKWYEDFCA
ncbi:hypothetical protein, partial [Psychromonas sp. Urea-02u-13]|uniref:hypothetical protein n=1 Tax=Psychromonas sp. Urea-02u-13 TaxID=2058326 RepID=UPI000C33E6A3